MTPISSLPQESLLAIFAQPCLTVCDLAHCCQVSRQWRQLASDDTLWRQRFPAAAALLTPQEGVAFRVQLLRSVMIRPESCSIMMRAEVFQEHLRALAQRVVRPGDACELTCQSLSDPYCRTIVQFGYGPRPAEAAVVRETLFSMDPVVQGGILHRPFDYYLTVLGNGRSGCRRSECGGRVSNQPPRGVLEMECEDPLGKVENRTLAEQQDLGERYCWSRIDHQYRMWTVDQASTVVQATRACAAPTWNFNGRLSGPGGKPEWVQVLRAREAELSKPQ